MFVITVATEGKDQAVFVITVAVAETGQDLVAYAIQAVSST